MKTLSAPLHQSRELEPAASRNWLGFLAASLRDIVSLAVAVVTAAAVVTLSVWLAGREAGLLLGACTWGLGFVFLGLAVDSRGVSAVLRWVTGIALPVLALLQTRVSPDFVIVSGVLLAAWAGLGILKRSAGQEI